MNKYVDNRILRVRTKTWKNTNNSMFSTNLKWTDSLRSWKPATSNTEAERGGFSL